MQPQLWATVPEKAVRHQGTSPASLCPPHVCELIFLRASMSPNCRGTDRGSLGRPDKIKVLYYAEANTPSLLSNCRSHVKADVRLPALTREKKHFNLLQTLKTVLALAGCTAGPCGSTHLGRLYSGAMRKQATTALFLCLDSSLCQTAFLDLCGCST